MHNSDNCKIQHLTDNGIGRASTNDSEKHETGGAHNTQIHKAHRYSRKEESKVKKRKLSCPMS